VTEPIAKLKELPLSSPERPGRVQKLMGIIFQSDQKTVLGSWIIRPVEMLDRRLTGLGRSPDNPSLAMHVGIHVLIDDGREFVVEQLVGTPFEDFIDGLNWTLETFRARDRGGWDVTIPATAFHGIDNEIVEGTIDFLNVISVRPFLDEDCTTMVERAFGKRRMFADSPAARTVGFGLPSYLYPLKDGANFLKASRRRSRDERRVRWGIAIVRPPCGRACPSRAVSPAYCKCPIAGKWGAHCPMNVES
jgi:hypothetical protein